MPKSYIVEKTAERLAKEDKLAKVDKYIDRAEELIVESNILEKRMDETGLFEKIWKRHLKEVEKAKKEMRKNKKLKKEEIEEAIKEKNFTRPQNVLAPSRKKIEEKRMVINRRTLATLLKDVRKWGIDGYRVIVELRKTVTGQEIIYHVQTSGHTYSYTLTEEQYINLLEKNAQGAGLFRTGWSGIEKAVDNLKKNTNSQSLDLFQLGVGAESSTIFEGDKNGKGKLYDKGNRTQLKHDALYQYLLKMDNGRAAIYYQKKNKETGVSEESVSAGISYSRIAELHSQMLYFYKTAIEKEGGLSNFVKNKKNEIKYFIEMYKHEKLHLDTDTFYESGDATYGVNTLVENKVGQATISIKTIREGLKKIVGLKGKTKEEKKQGFIQIFTKKIEGDKTLTKDIQEGAYNVAVNSIEKLFS